MATNQLKSLDKCTLCSTDYFQELNQSGRGTHTLSHVAKKESLLIIPVWKISANPVVFLLETRKYENSLARSSSVLKESMHSEALNANA